MNVSAFLFTSFPPDFRAKKILLAVQSKYAEVRSWPPADKFPVKFFLIPSKVKRWSYRRRFKLEKLKKHCMTPHYMIIILLQVTWTEHKISALAEQSGFDITPPQQMHGRPPLDKIPDKISRLNGSNIVAGNENRTITLSEPRLTSKRNTLPARRKLRELQTKIYTYHATPVLVLINQPETR